MVVLPDMSESGRGPAQARFAELHSQRRQVLSEKRDAVILTKPWLDDFSDSHTQNHPLRSEYTSFGNTGMTNVRTLLMGVLWPIDEPPWDMESLPEIATLLDQPDIGAAERSIMADQLDLVSLGLMNILLTAGTDADSPDGSGYGFLKHKGQVLDHLLIVGQTLEKLNDDFTMELYPLSRHVTKRNGRKQPIEHVIRRPVDPLSLSPEVRAKAKITADKMKATGFEHRVVSIYDHVEWHADTTVWTLTQEINGHVVHEETLGRFSPYISTAFEVAKDDDVGTSYAHGVLKDLRKLNELEQRFMSLVDVASNKHLAVGVAPRLRVADLYTKPPGAPVFGLDVSGGAVQNAAWFGADTIREIQMLSNTINELKVELGPKFLLGVARDSERTTSEEIRSVTLRQLNGVLGGILPSIMEDQHRPLANLLVRRAVASGALDKVFDPGNEQVKVKVGQAGIARANRLDRLRSAVADITSLSQASQLIPELNRKTMMSRIFSDSAVDPRGLMHTEAELAARQQGQQDQFEDRELARAAIGEGARAAGQIAVARATG